MRLKSNPKRIISLALAGCMAVSMVPASAVTAFAAETGTGSSVTALAENEDASKPETSGTCGAEGHESDVQWSFDSTTGVLSITGTSTGKMADYSSKNPPEWTKSFSNQIKEVKIGEGVTYIGDVAFGNLTNLVKVNIPASIAGFGWYIFVRDTSLTTVEWADDFNAPEVTDRESTTDKDGNAATYTGQYVPSGMFDGCTSLGQGVELTEWLPKSFTGVACPAFRGTQFKVDFDRWDNLSYIGAYAFDSMPNLSSFTVTDKIQFGYRNGQSGAFVKSGLRDITFSTNDVDLSMVKNTNLEQLDVTCGTLNAPSKLWQENNTLKNVRLSAQDCTIGEHAFYMANALETFSLETNSVTLQSATFSRCKSLKKIDLSQCENITYVNRAFLPDDNAATCPETAGATPNDVTIYVNSEKNNPRNATRMIGQTEIKGAGLSDIHGIVIVTNGGKVDVNASGFDCVTKAGYTAIWYEDADCTQMTKDTTPEVGKTYYAKWGCTVSFNTNGHGEKPDDVVVEPGQMLNNIPSPGTADGWVFDGWYLDPDFNHEFTTTEIINQNTTVYAKWHEFTNTTVTATASKDGEYLLSEPVEIDFKVNIGDDINSIENLSLEYGDEVESVKLNGTELEKDKKDYTKNDLLNILNQKPEGTLTVTYNKTGKHTFGVVLKDSDGKETSKASVDVTVVEMMMDATVTENGESKESYKANEPVKVTLKVTPSDLDAFKEDVLHLTYGEEVEKVELNGHKLTEKQYKISDLLDMMNSAASQVATYALGAEEVNIPLDVTYKTAGTHAFKMEVKNTDGDLICQDSVNVTIAEEQKPDPKPENPVTTYALTVADGTVKVNGKDAAANESGAYAVEKDAKVEVTFDKTTLSDAQVFDQWTITPASVLNEVDPKSETISFTMPAEEVSIKAMTRDATIEDDGPGVLGTAAMIGVGVAGTAVLGYQGYMIGTELYLNNVLPAGAAIPNNATELALLVWTDAGKPAPAAVLAPDATDEQKALTWAVENQLISADKAADASVTRWEVIQAWNQEQEMKKA